jgi:alpha-beta hydrolase superfamily lysophospholipase
MKARRRWLRAASAGLLFIILAVGGFAWWLGGAFIASANHAVPMPADFPAVTVSIPGVGHAIAGSLRDLGPATPVVLLLHGMGGDRRSMLPRARLLVAAGISVLLIDLQGHGETPGEHITLGWRESDDVRVALEWLRERGPARRIGVIGVSLGGAAFLLGEAPPQVDALVLEAVHPRLRRAIENRVGRWFAPLLLIQVEPRLGVRIAKLNPVRHIAAVDAPVLVVGGARDTDTTEEETRALFAAAREPKELWIVPGAGHEDFSRIDADGYRRHVVEFLRRHLGG